MLRVVGQQLGCSTVLVDLRGACAEKERKATADTMEAIDSELSVLRHIDGWVAIVRSRVAECFAKRVELMQLLELALCRVVVVVRPRVNALKQWTAEPPERAEAMSREFAPGALAQRFAEKFRGTPEQQLQFELKMVTPAKGKRVHQHILVSPGGNLLEHHLSCSLKTKSADKIAALLPVEVGNGPPVVPRSKEGVGSCRPWDVRISEI